jgi:hypothetical protein
MNYWRKTTAVRNSLDLPFQVTSPFITYAKCKKSVGYSMCLAWPTPNTHLAIPTSRHNVYLVSKEQGLSKASKVIMDKHSVVG